MALSVMSECKGGKTETQLGTMVSGQVHGLARRTRWRSCLTDFRAARATTVGSCGMA
jgi:hypothetical protein